ncbi:YggS family pyridoxal phosphate-dependent enzyme [Glaciimonas sp. PAMC28666]|uniref:YggS family pyridoxal phosphate-dependent enzyme n=1 Tax=Glaciimonas sp. PAMC28666 TaxID=2807626 RepID=UPI0019663E6E|nr:YggS family pyridoxal phosphate-dependent enzyme [Glaciimonas sp. PAMC28666]QRX80951.1 YggS family pyridoxal phosphate-dependent enzyme [Glaciimonas sp. PAMC28666]
MSSISQKLQAVHESIRNSTAQASRPGDAVALLAVSKTFGADAVLEAIAAGQFAFGENYLQEALDKIIAVRTATTATVATAAAGLVGAVEWHFIGPIQSNKTRAIAENFAWVHTVEREKIAQRLSDQRPAALAPLNVCLQVNISNEASKSGVAPEDALAVAQAIAALPRLRLRGLMAIPEASDDPVQQRAAFRRLRQLFIQLQESGLMIDTLSMGMSGDMDSAIAEGATIVRVGSAIFGRRDQASSV